MLLKWHRRIFNQIWKYPKDKNRKTLSTLSLLWRNIRIFILFLANHFFKKKGILWKIILFPEYFSQNDENFTTKEMTEIMWWKK
jgi:fido (protein-threonine AMPylation protein)